MQNILHQHFTSTFKTHLTWPLEQIYVMSPASPLLLCILWKAVMPFFFFLRLFHPAWVYWRPHPAGESERQSTIVLHWIANALPPTQRTTYWVGGLCNYIGAFYYYHDKGPQMHICLFRRCCKLKSDLMDVLVIRCWGAFIVQRNYRGFNRLQEVRQRAEGKKTCLVRSCERWI